MIAIVSASAVAAQKKRFCSVFYPGVGIKGLPGGNGRRLYWLL